MKALHVSPYFAPAFRYGGPVQSVLGLCRGLAESGVDVTVLTTSIDGDGEIPADIVRRKEYDGVPVRYLRTCFPRRYFNAEGLVEALQQMLPSADLVHLHGLWSFPVWIAARECQRAGVPFVVSPRGMLDAGSLAHHGWRKKLMYQIRERNYLSQAAMLHATSPSEVESLERLSLGPRIVRLPNGVSPPTSVADGGFRERLGLTATDGFIVFLGRLHPIKRLDLLVAALDIVRGQCPGARVVLAGPVDGVEAKTLRELAREPEAVEWLGELSAAEKWPLLSEADVVVLCSDSESFGMSVVEAMAMGTPVVVTTTCPWEEVATEQTGLWVAQTREDVAEAILRVLRDRRSAEAMGERGRELVRERYRWSTIGRQMSVHYQGLIA